MPDEGSIASGRRRPVCSNGGILRCLARVSYRADTRTNQTGEWRDVVWYVIDTPDPATPTGATSVFSQGRLKGAAVFGKLEGAWYGNGSIYFVASSGGNAGQGQVFEYDPGNQRLRLLFESPSADELNAPDNLTVSPRGGLVVRRRRRHRRCTV
jgi:hypothetical protein